MSGEPRTLCDIFLAAAASGKPDLLQGAKAMCDFNTTFNVEPGKNCKGVAVALGVKR